MASDRLKSIIQAEKAKLLSLVIAMHTLCIG